MILAALSWAVTVAVVGVHLRTRRRLVDVARACHELRGPLFAVQLGLSGLGAEPARLAAIELELARAGRALDDLAAAPSGTRVEGRRELVDVCELVESYAPAWRALAAGYGASLRVEPPLIVSRFDSAAALAGTSRGAHLVPVRPAVRADPLRIAQACANLVGNAAEHGGGVVRVRVRATGRSVRIEVADDGPGLPRSVSALTAAARTRRGRRGHGLAIASAIAEHHGGRLSAGPSEHGARLVLEMPAAGA